MISPAPSLLHSRRAALLALVFGGLCIAAGAPALGAEEIEPAPRVVTDGEALPRSGLAPPTALETRAFKPVTAPPRPPRRKALRPGQLSPGLSTPLPPMLGRRSLVARSGPVPRRPASGERGPSTKPRMQQSPEVVALAPLPEAVAVVERALPAPAPAPEAAAPTRPRAALISRSIPGAARRRGRQAGAVIEESRADPQTPPDSGTASSTEAASPLRPLRRARLAGLAETPAVAALTPGETDESILPSILDGLTDYAVAPAGVSPAVLPVTPKPVMPVPERPSPAGIETEVLPELKPRDRDAGQAPQLARRTPPAQIAPQPAPRKALLDALPKPAPEGGREKALETVRETARETARESAREPAPGAAPPSSTIRELLRDRMKPERVVARVNDEEIRWADVVESSRSLPDSYKDRLDSLFPALLRRLIDMKLLAQAGRDMGLDDDDRIRTRVKAFEEELIRREVLRLLVEEMVSDEMLEEAKAALAAQSGAGVKVKARHILLGSEAESRAVIAALDGGADFAGLARERSQGASGRRGGDLGNFELSRMPAPFVEAVSGLEVGSYTREPVQSEFGWHVILLEARDERLAPKPDQTEDQLRQAMAREAIDGLLKQLRGQAEIETMPGPSAGADDETSDDDPDEDAQARAEDEETRFESPPETR